MLVELYSEQTVCENLEIDPQTLQEYQRLGLVQTRQVGHRVGFGPAEVRRIWSIVSLQRDLGLDLDAIEVVLQMRDQIVALQLRMLDLLEQVKESQGAAESARSS